MLQSELSLHAIIVSWQVYYIESKLWRHITRKNQKIARSPHILGRLNACSNSVYQALFRFSRAPGRGYAEMWAQRKNSQQFQICCARTKYPSEIHKSRFMPPICLRLERVLSVKNWVKFGSSDFLKLCYETKGNGGFYLMYLVQKCLDHWSSLLSNIFCCITFSYRRIIDSLNWH